MENTEMENTEMENTYGFFDGTKMIPKPCPPRNEIIDDINKSGRNLETLNRDGLMDFIRE